MVLTWRWVVRETIALLAMPETINWRVAPETIRLTDAGWCEPDAADRCLHAALVLEGPEIPEGEVAASIESSTGELGFWLVCDGQPLPRRIRCRGASFLHAQAMPAMLRGAHLDDLLPTAAVLHLISAECDR